jgi:hypothetical protein
MWGMATKPWDSQMLERQSAMPWKYWLESKKHFLRPIKVWRLAVQFLKTWKSNYPTCVRLATKPWDSKRLERQAKLLWSSVETGFAIPQGQEIQLSIFSEDWPQNLETLIYGKDNQQCFQTTGQNLDALLTSTLVWRLALQFLNN